MDHIKYVAHPENQDNDAWRAGFEHELERVHRILAERLHITYEGVDRFTVQ